MLEEEDRGGKEERGEKRTAAETKEAAARGVAQGEAEEGAARGIVLVVGAVLAKKVADKVAGAAVAIAGAGAGAATLAGAVARGGAAMVAARRDGEAFCEGFGKEGHGVFAAPFFLASAYSMYVWCVELGMKLGWLAGGPGSRAAAAAGGELILSALEKSGD